MEVAAGLTASIARPRLFILGSLIGRGPWHRNVTHLAR